MFFLFFLFLLVLSLIYKNRRREAMGALVITLLLGMIVFCYHATDILKINW